LLFITFLCLFDSKMRYLVAVAFVICVSELSVAASVGSFQSVDTSNGRVTGHRSVKVNDVWEYLGIPYANPPIGDLRFAAPQKYERKGPYNAGSFVSVRRNTWLTRLFD